MRHVAHLARLGLTEERAKELAKELNTILEHMDVLGRVDTAGVEEFATDGSAGMRLRDDGTREASLGGAAPQFAPAMRERLFLVPRLATHEDPENPE